MNFRHRNLILGTADTLVFMLLYFFMALVVTNANFAEMNCTWLAFGVLALQSAAKVLINFGLGLYKRMFEYRGRRDILFMALVSGVSSLLVLAIFIALAVANKSPLLANALIASFPIEVAYIVLSRLVIAYYFELRKRNQNNTLAIRRTIIIGAGSAGQIAFNEVLHNNSKGLKIVGFVDDDPNKIGRVFCNEKVYGPISRVNEIKNKLEAEVVLICCPGAGVDRIKEISNMIDYKDTEVLVMPEVTKMLSTDVTPRMRKVEISDLLGRKAIDVIDDSTEAFYQDKVVLITGGGGSIGSELCRQVAKMHPKQIIILDIYENCAYDIQQELRMKYGVNFNLKVEIISITNRPAMERVFEKYRPNIVVMAAAHKHVPLMENNVVEAVENNVFGTLNTVELAEKYGVDRVHMVSTDKAVNPTSVMGATKRICEMIVQSHSQIEQHTTFSATRFGNVLGSAGSVVPLFKRQIENGGPITLTDYRIIRYFMTIPEASQLVLTSASMAKNGELFVLDMGEPVKIYDLAKNMIRLSGLELDTDIKIIETGLRPGEKLYEELLVKTEELDKTDNSLIFIERDKPLPLEQVDNMLAKLKEGILVGDDANMKNIIKSVVPTFIEKEEANKGFNGKEVK